MDLVGNAIDSEDCILLLTTYMKCKNIKADVKRLKQEAVNLSKNNMDRYWLFVYEVLPQDKLSGDYKVLKQNNVSFLKNYIIKP